MTQWKSLLGALLLSISLAACGNSAPASDSGSSDSDQTKLEQYGDCLFRYSDGNYTAEEIENICRPILD